MNRIYSLFPSFAVLFFMLFSTNLAYAGGQLVSLEADSNGAINSDGSYGRTMRVVSRAFTCEGTEVTFKFVDPKDGDSVITSSGNATFVFTKDRPPYYKNGEQVCGTTAKMGSKVLGERDVTVVVKSGNDIWSDPPVIKVDFDGKYYGDNSYNGHNYRSSQDDPYYALTHPQTTTPQPTPVSTLPIVSPKPTTPSVVASPTSNPNDKEVEELNQKVENLQNQLEISKQKQNFLEQRINDLVAFIKNLFPFFK